MEERSMNITQEKIDREKIGLEEIGLEEIGLEEIDHGEIHRGEIDREIIDREEIVRDLESNIFVEAGAGAGKTSILIRRILNQLRTGTAKAEELVAITFTNKASQELKSRIGDAVRRALHDAAPGSTEQQNLKDALYNMDRMQISTIHSFCYRLLMEQTFLAAMRMDMEMIEDEDALEEQEAFFRSWYKTLDYESVQHVRANFAGRRVVPVLKQAFSDICELPEDTEIFYDRSLLARSLQSFMDEAAEQKEKYAGIILDELNRETGMHFDSLELAAEEGAFLAAFKKLVLGNNSDIVFLKKAKDLRIFKSGKPLGMKKAVCDDMNTNCSGQFFQSFDLDAYDRDFRAYQNALILDFIMPARREYKRLHQNRYITNNTLLEKARDLVVNHPEARAFFQRKYKCIYVDEFQDTDHVQTDLIFALCSDEHGGLKAGSLFVVGDPKQSIYRFRGADLPLYFSVKKKMAEMPGCRLFNLDFNFRSGEEVIDFVNGNNAQILQDYRPMESRSREPADGRPAKQISGVYINWDPSVSIAEQLEEQGPRDDVGDVVQIIRGLVDNQIIIWDKDAECHRPVCYKDFLVLCYSTYHMEDYLAEMLVNGIPVQISGKVIMNTVRELNRFTNLYRYLAYPQYARAREGALQTVLAENVNDDNYRIGMERLGMILDAVKGMDGISMALYLLRHPEYVLDWDYVIDKYYLLRIQAQIQQMIETVSSTCVNNAQALSDGFMEYVAGEVDRELSLSAESDAVRFMNLHKAKGLEGRIVIICKRSESFEPKEGSFQVRKDDGGYLFYNTVVEKTGAFSSNKYPAYVHDDEIRRRAEEEELAEYRRLEYVEATRGMEALIFTMPMTDKKDTKQYSFRCYDFSGCKRIEEEFPEIYGEAPDSIVDAFAEDDLAEDSVTEDAVAEDTVAAEAFLEDAFAVDSVEVDSVEVDSVEVDAVAEDAVAADAAITDASVTKAEGAMDVENGDPGYAEYDFHRWDPEFTEDTFRAGYLTLTPSSLETRVTASGEEVEAADEVETVDEEEAVDAVAGGADASTVDGAESPALDEAAGQDSAKRPIGNIFGTVMHRALELLVPAIREGAVIEEQKISAYALQAIMENGDEMEDAFGAASDRRAAEYLVFLKKVLGKFASTEDVAAGIRKAEAVYTELPFSFFTSEEEAPEMFAALRAKISGKKAEKLLPKDPKQQVWVNGKADLVLIGTDGSIRICDYKSDWNTGLPGEAFAEIIARRYGGQMELYRYACARIFHTPIDRISGGFYLID